MDQERCSILRFYVSVKYEIKNHLILLGSYAARCEQHALEIAKSDHPHLVTGIRWQFSGDRGLGGWSSSQYEIPEFSAVASPQPPG